MWLRFVAAFPPTGRRRVPCVVLPLGAMHSRRPLALLTLCVLLLAACGGGDPEPEDTDKAPPGVDCKAKPQLCI